MYIDPFWAGVFATITVEVIMFLIFMLYTIFKVGRGGQNGTGEFRDNNSTGLR